GLRASSQVKRARWVAGCCHAQSRHAPSTHSHSRVQAEPARRRARVGRPWAGMDCRMARAACPSRKQGGQAANENTAALRPPRRRASASRADQAAASLSFFSGRTLTLTEAGLAANHCSSLVNGLMPLRFGLAGTLTEVTLNRPGRVKLPAPFLLIAPETASSTAARTALTSLATTPLVSDRCLIRADLPRTSFSGAAFFGAAAFF